MKAIAVTHMAGRITTRLYADSAISRDVMPLFLPDIPATWQGCVCLALRIGRLGKSVSPAFAMRYVDAYTAVSVQCTDADIDTSIMDQAVVAGQWLDIASLGAEVCLRVAGSEIRYDVEAIRVPEVIAFVTRYTTIKTGDIIILTDISVPVRLVAPDRICAAVGDQECLRMKIR